MSQRNLALDRVRTFVTLLVLLNHAVVAYTAFSAFYPRNYLLSSAPIVDSHTWIGFNVVTLFNDVFFMPLMFLLSGLFVWSSLTRKGVRTFVWDRVLRLGLPFALCIFVLMPIAYYASFKMTGSSNSFGEFYADNVRNGVWFSGPGWFIWFLLALDIAVIPILLLLPKLIDALNRLSLASFERSDLFVAALAVAAIAAFIPLFFTVGGVAWFSQGPFQVQAARTLIYTVYFLAGVGIGARHLGQGVIAPGGSLARHWRAYLVIAAALFAVLAFLVFGLQAKLFGNLPQWWLLIYSVVFPVTGVAISAAILALFLRFGQGARNLLDPMQPYAYGMFVFHYPICIWLQYALLDWDVHGIIKVAVVLPLTIALSWAAAMLARRLPGAQRVL